ncbi:extracellular solute-binding protein [Streptomyces sp. AV19]|uniref:extracellular solute-binding protein n=1 Tax=Streptomyces sp. AV19 TaxID=2793068 RepID=UPI0018FE227E|nr:extracellular solute-binding protein [Streptomyces sp. AV19]MBH1932807.1 extracellular solute-binding protein [Streptomyces sp. AV19]MDG4531472.1 extracellular solute-binding protein [Streptomyces sp. AV19]
MAPSARRTTAGLLLALAAVASCAPSTSVNSATGDSRTGTLRVWLFREVNNKPKEAVVADAVDAFVRDHRGVRVEVGYIPVETRAEKIKAAFNDPGSAPDLVEYGNTDTAGHVKDGGLADVTAELAARPGADAAAVASVTVDGKLYGAPLSVGVRALYYRTDVFRELGLAPPRTLAELAATARRIHRERPRLYGLAVGGAYTYGALPFVWAHGGDVARRSGRTWRAAIDDEKSRAGVRAWTGLFGDDNCPASRCAAMGGNDTVQAFASGRAAMAIAGDFNRKAVDDGPVRGRYAVVPLPGREPGHIAPAFAGGNNIGVLRSSSHRTLAVDLMKSLTSRRTQDRLFDAMGFLPASAEARRAAARRQPFAEPFVRTLDAGTVSLPASPGWAAIDAGQVLPTMFQEIVSGRKDVDAATTAAARRMDEAFRR